jgi:hypothetical protein
MKLVMVHGRSQQDLDPIPLRHEWEASLEQGWRSAGLARPAGLEVAFPYFGDRLDRLVQEYNSPLLINVLSRGEVPDHELEFRAQLLSELAALNGISEAEIERQAAVPVTQKGVLNWEWVHAILKSFDGKPIGSRVVDRFTRDVYLYSTIPGIRDEVDSIVRSDIEGGRAVVIGHSLGSVVAYNVLRKAGAGTQVPLYATVGSPLGLQTVNSFIERPLKMPACTSQWFNAFDPRDVVALVPLDSEHFGIAPPIRNKADVDNDTDNRHGISGYLKNPEVAAVIHQALVAA